MPGYCYGSHYLKPEDRKMREPEKSLEELVRELPPDVEQEVRDFVEFVLQRRTRKPLGRPDFEWAGALKDMRDHYTSVELQHKLSEWRTGGE
jgi:hypothetical protein